jgi:hypothetical protein
MSLVKNIAILIRGLGLGFRWHWALTIVRLGRPESPIGSNPHHFVPFAQKPTECETQEKARFRGPFCLGDADVLAAARDGYPEQECDK